MSEATSEPSSNASPDTSGPRAELVGKGVIGTNFSDLCKQVGQKLQAEHDANFERDTNRLKAEQERAIDGRQEYFVSVERLPNGFIKAETIDDLPFVGRIGAIGRSYESAIVELRFGYAYQLHKDGYLPTLDDARRHACRANFKPDLGQSRLVIRP